MLKYKKKGDLYIFEKENVFFALDISQVNEMANQLAEIIEDNQPLVFACTVEAGHAYRTCVFDTGDLDDCVLAEELRTKHDCEYWQKVRESEIEEV